MHVQLMTRMLRDHSPAQIRWSCRAILNWEFDRSPSAPVCAIHGENDEVIPIKNVSAQFPISNGRHLINLTHAQEVNAVIINYIRSFGERSGAP